MKYKVIKKVVNKHGVAGNEAQETLFKNEFEIQELIKVSIHKANAVTHITLKNGGVITMFLIQIQTKDLFISYGGELDEDD